MCVEAFMVQHLLRGPGQGSFITGQSVHNQRIERLWYDVFLQCTILFYKLFHDIKDQGILDIDDEVHLLSPLCVYTTNELCTMSPSGHLEQSSSFI